MSLEQKQKSEKCSKGDLINQKKNAYFKGKSLQKIIMWPLGNFSCVNKKLCKDFTGFTALTCLKTRAIRNCQKTTSCEISHPSLCSQLLTHPKAPGVSNPYVRQASAPDRDVQTTRVFCLGYHKDPLRMGISMLFSCSFVNKKLTFVLLQKYHAGELSSEENEVKHLPKA